MVEKNYREAARQFLGVASVQAQLFSVRQISKRISLSAKNAKAIAARAGSQALGFHPITDFIDDVATNITRLVEKINVDALHLSSYAIDSRNRIETLNRVKQAEKLLSKKADKRGLARKITQMERDDSRFFAEFARKNEDLQESLQEIRTQLQAAEMICTTSRTEATRAGDFQKNLQVVADEVAEAVSQIKDVLQTCKTYLGLTVGRRR